MGNSTLSHERGQVVLAQGEVRLNQRVLVCGVWGSGGDHIPLEEGGILQREEERARGGRGVIVSDQKC